VAGQASVGTYLAAEPKLCEPRDRGENTTLMKISIDDNEVREVVVNYFLERYR
jgi:hypothetical protein